MPIPLPTASSNAVPSASGTSDLGQTRDAQALIIEDPGLDDFNPLALGEPLALSPFNITLPYDVLFDMSGQLLLDVWVFPITDSHPNFPEFQTPLRDDVTYFGILKNEHVHILPYTSPIDNETPYLVLTLYWNMAFFELLDRILECPEVLARLEHGRAVLLKRTIPAFHPID